MRLLLATVGRLKDGAERELFDRYAERLDAAGRALALGPLHLIEVPESRAATAELRKSDEARRLLEAAERADLRVALDAHGKAQSSEAFAKWISKKRDDGTKALAFLIGGSDGRRAGPAVIILEGKLGAGVASPVLGRVVGSNGPPLAVANPHQAARVNSAGY